VRAAALAFLLAGTAIAQTVTGSVSNAVTRQPLTGVSVGLAGPQSAGSLQTKTDSTGSFRIAAPAGDYAVIVLQPGFDLPNLETLKVHVEDGRDPAPLEVTLTPYPKLSGRVLDPERHSLAGIQRSRRKRNRCTWSGARRPTLR